MCDDNRPCAAKNFLERVSRAGHKPKEEIYNVLINSLCKCNFIEEALLLKTEMICKDMKPNLVAYKSLIVWLCALNRSTEGENLMREMIEFGASPDIATCRTLINGFCRERTLVKQNPYFSYLPRNFKFGTQIVVIQSLRFSVRGRCW